MKRIHAMILIHMTSLPTVWMMILPNTSASFLDIRSDNIAIGLQQMQPKILDILKSMCDASEIQMHVGVPKHHPVDKFVPNS